MQEGQLDFTFPVETTCKLDAVTPLPHRMCLADFLITEEERMLLVEVKDPSANDKAMRNFRKKHSNRTVYVEQELLLKARDSYTYLHLMGKDTKPLDFAVIMALEKLPDLTEPLPESKKSKESKSLLVFCKELLEKKIIQEGPLPWKRQYINKIYVCTIDTWNKYFPEYPCSRIEKLE